MDKEILLLFLLCSVSSLNIRIDENNGIDSIECLIEQLQSSCQSLKYVADAFSNTGNLTIEIISPTLSIQDNVTFTDINGLTINGQGESLTTIQVQSVTAGISFLHCGEVVLANFTLNTVTDSLLYDSHLISEDQCSFTTNGNYSLFFLNPKKLTIKNCNFTSSNDTYATYNGTLIKLSNTTGAANISIHNVFFSNFTVGLKVLLYNSWNITLYVNDTKFVNNKVGFDVIAINSINNSISVIASQFNGNKYHGLEMYYETSCHNNFTIFGCTFSNNTGCNGVSMDLVLVKNSTSNIFRGIGNRFINNSAEYAGGGVNIDILSAEGYRYNYPSNNTIIFKYCYFINNSGSYAGGVGILMASVRLKHTKKSNYIKFISCHFCNNKASSGSAVHINRNIPSESGSYFVALVFFYDCKFTSNGQPHFNFMAGGNAVLQSGAFYANKVCVYFGGKTQFTNNNSTALQVSDINIEFEDNSTTIFQNNSGIKGGAILLTGDSELYVKYNTSIIFNGNRAVSYGGAIAVLHLQVQNLAYSDKCFLSVHFHKKYHYNSKPVFTFTDNKCDSDFGNDLFISNLESCRARCKTLLHEKDVYVSISDIFSSKCFGVFNFSARSIATPTKNLSVSQVINAIPGIPMKLNITQKDMFENDTSALFPLTLTISGTNRIRINPHVITNNSHVTFYGNPNPHKTAKLLIQTETMTSISVTAELNLINCPPGFIFDKTDSCVCSALSNNRYQGIRYCTSNYSAITTNYWAGYLNISNASDDTFVTGHCGVELCSYNKTKHKFGFYQLPIDYDKEKLNDFVCSSNRTGTLCTKCIDNHIVSYHSPSFKCEPSHHCHYGILLYILSELLPITIIFI
uniref:Right handed beta helix domain-containing protein n=1 Tax=Amphimedon queenslandica TaxID=400682 RepID=A0A1X7UBN9_AMPQE